MATGINRLAVKTVEAWARAAPAARTPKKLQDGGGLFLSSTQKGTPVWRFRFVWAGKDQLMSLGEYPEIGLQAARAQLAEVRSQLREGKHPIQARRLKRAASVSSSLNTFDAVADEWLEARRRGWSSIHFTTTRQAIARDVLPSLGALPVSEISPLMIADVLRPVFNRAPVTAGKIRWNIEAVLRYAEAKGLIPLGANPAIPAKELLKSMRPKPGRHPALLEWAELGDVLRRADAARLSPAVRMAHRLCAFTAMRIGNVVSAEWVELELEGASPVWTIPRAKMKAQDRHDPHRAFLGTAIVLELKRWREISSRGRYVFPAVAGKKEFISPEAIEKAYRVTLGLKDKHSPHGWRSAFATRAREEGFERDAVETALDHSRGSEVERAYDRGERRADRIRLAEWWNAGLIKAESGT